MLQKNIDKEQRKNRPTWAGYYSRKTPTRKTLERRIDKKYAKTLYEN